MTDWTKVFEVFVSGIFGVYLVMFLLMVLTQLCTRIIDRFELMIKETETENKPQV